MTINKKSFLSILLIFALVLISGNFHSLNVSAAEEQATVESIAFTHYGVLYEGVTLESSNSIYVPFKSFDLTINYSDGSSSLVSTRKDSTTGDYIGDYYPGSSSSYDASGYFACRVSGLDYPIKFNSNQSEKWGIGKHNVTVSYKDVSCNYSVEVVENPIKAISVKTTQITENEMPNENNEYSLQNLCRYLQTEIQLKNGNVIDTKKLYEENQYLMKNDYTYWDEGTITGCETIYSIESDWNNMKTNATDWSFPPSDYEVSYETGQWNPTGTNQVTISFLGASTTIEISPDYKITTIENKLPNNNNINSAVSNDSNNNTTNQQSTKEPATKNTILTDTKTKNQYKVTSSSTKKPTVTYMKSTNKKTSNVSIPASVTINNVKYNVTSIAAKAFANNKTVKNITIGKNIVTIGKNAFSKCKKLKKITINSTKLKSIGANTFSGNKKLSKIVIKSKKLKSSSIGKNAFKGTSSKLVIKVPEKKYAAYKKFLTKKGNKKLKVTK